MTYGQGFSESAVSSGPEGTMRESYSPFWKLPARLRVFWKRLASSPLGQTKQLKVSAHSSGKPGTAAQALPGQEGTST